MAKYVIRHGQAKAQRDPLQRYQQFAECKPKSFLEHYSDNWYLRARSIACFPEGHTQGTLQPRGREGPHEETSNPTYPLGK